MTVTENELFMVEASPNSVELIKQFGYDPSDKNGRHVRMTDAAFNYITLTHTANGTTPMVLCSSTDNAAMVSRMNSYMSSHGISPSTVLENEYVGVLSKEIAYLNTLYNNTKTIKPTSGEFFDKISTVELFTRSLNDFLGKHVKPKTPELKSAIKKYLENTENLCVTCEKRIVASLCKDGLFFAGLKPGEKEKANRNPLDLNASSFIKFGDHEDGNKRTLSKEEYMARWDLLSCLNGFSSNKMLEDKGDTAARKKAAKAAASSTTGVLSESQKKCISYIESVISGKAPDVEIEVTNSRIERTIFDRYFHGNPDVTQLTVIDPRTRKNVPGSKAKVSVINDIITKIKADVASGGLSASSAGRVSKLQISAEKLAKIIDAAYQSLSNGAAAGGVEPADLISAQIDAVYAKIQKFKDREFQNEQELDSYNVTMHDFARRKLVDDEAYAAAEKLIQEVYLLKKAQLGVVASLTTVAASAKSEEKAQYKGDANMFNFNIKTALKFGVITIIDTVNNVREKRSWTKMLAAACHEIWGYEPLGEVTNVINMYSANRALNGAIIKRVGEITDSIIQIVLPNFNLGTDIGNYVNNSLQQHGGEVDPEIVELEGRLRNFSVSVAHASPLKKHISREDRHRQQTYKITDKPHTPNDESTAEENKRNKTINKNLTGPNEGADYNYLRGISTINEDFAMAGGLTGTTGTTGGAGQCVDSVVPGLNNMTVPVSGMGPVVPPTPEQTPFSKSCEKTTGGGSGDFGAFTMKSTKKNKKKYQPTLPLIKVGE